MRGERLACLVDYLLRERGERLDKPEATEVELADMFRALMNIRAPKPISREYLRLQDEELQWQLQRKGIVTVEASTGGRGCPAVTVWQGDITRLQVDAIVNAANSQMLGCFHPLHGCIDNAIHSAAGVQLRLECAGMGTEAADFENGNACEVQRLRLPVGEARMTRGYNLPAKYVIHTVGPVITHGTPTREQCAKLASCYENALGLAEENGLRTIALCCISTGEFRFPRQKAAEIAVATVNACTLHVRNIRQVIFDVLKDEDYRVYTQLLGSTP